MRRVSKEFTVAFQGVLGNTRLLVRFQDGCENNLSLNKLTIVILEKIPEEKEPEVSEIDEIPEDQVELEKLYYQCVSGTRGFLVRFQNGCENNLSLNQLTVVIVEKIPVEEEPEVSTIPEILEDQVEK